MKFLPTHLPTNPRRNKMTWNYRAVKDHSGMYTVHEVYDGASYTEAITPRNESIEELITDLELMAESLKKNGEYKETLRVYI